MWWLPSSPSWWPEWAQVKRQPSQVHTPRPGPGGPVASPSAHLPPCWHHEEQQREPLHGWRTYQHTEGKYLTKLYWTSLGDHPDIKNTSLLRSHRFSSCFFTLYLNSLMRPPTIKTSFLETCWWPYYWGFTGVMKGIIAHCTENHSMDSLQLFHGGLVNSQNSSPGHFIWLLESMPKATDKHADQQFAKPCCLCTFHGKCPESSLYC